MRFKVRNVYKYYDLFQTVTPLESIGESALSLPTPITNFLITFKFFYGIQGTMMTILF